MRYNFILFFSLNFSINIIYAQCVRLWMVFLSFFLALFWFSKRNNFFCILENSKSLRRIHFTVAILFNFCVFLSSCLIFFFTSFFCVVDTQVTFLLIKSASHSMFKFYMNVNTAQHPNFTTRLIVVIIFLFTLILVVVEKLCARL